MWNNICQGPGLLLNPSMRTASSTSSRTFLEAIVVVGIGCFAGMVSNAVSAKRIPLIGDWGKKYGVPSAGGVHSPTYGNVEIDLHEAARLFNEGAVFLDSRPAEEYALGHVPGARSVPEEEFRERIAGVLDSIQDAPAVVAYCRGMECDEAHILSRSLREMGVERVFVFAGGMDEWKAARRPVETEPEAEDEGPAG